LGESPFSSPRRAMVSMTPPLSAREVHTMFSTPPMVFWSVPVTSMKRFLVAVVTAVSLPLMIGGNDSTSLL